MLLYYVSGSGKLKSDNKKLIIAGYAIINENPISGTIGQPGVTFEVVSFSISAATENQTYTFISPVSHATGASYIKMGNLDDYLRLNGELEWSRWHFDEQRRPPCTLADTMSYGHDVMSLYPDSIEINELNLTKN